MSNKLLKKTNLVLFLNKTDILRAKLEAGISFAQYIVAYGERPNDYDNTSYCASHPHTHLFTGPRPRRVRGDIVTTS